MARSSSWVGILIIPGLFLCLFIWAWIYQLIEEKAKEKANRIFLSKENEFLSELNLKKQKIEEELRKKISDIEEKYKRLNEVINVQNNLFKEKTIGFPWVAEQYSIYASAILNDGENFLRNKKYPALKSAEIVSILKQRTKEAEKKYFISQGILNYYESLFPWLQELRGAPDEIISPASKETEDLEEDPAKQYLTDGEWSSFSTQEKFQRSLDRYWTRHKSKWEIGRLYERFIGYEYETNGWDVNFFGAIKGLEDLGRDLIVKKAKMLYIIQCKNWSSEKVIHEKHIFQLFGTCILYELEYNKKAKGLFITSCQLSDVAKKCASMLGIEIIENKKLQKFPSIKCNIGWSGEKIYHLPFDQQYDKVKIEINKGEFYCLTIKEAEEAGFRRAFRWRGNA